MGFADCLPLDVNHDPLRAPKSAAASGEVSGVGSDWDADAVGEDDFKNFTPLSREQAEALRGRLLVISPWRVIRWQALAAAVLVALWCVPEGSQWRSALAGGAAVVLPNALMAWGTTRRAAVHAGAALASLMFWELIKIVLVAVGLLAAIKGMPDLSWPALLSTVILCLKMNWLVLFWQGRIKK